MDDIYLSNHQSGPPSVNIAMWPPFGHICLFQLTLHVHHSISSSLMRLGNCIIFYVSRNQLFTYIPHICWYWLIKS